MFEEGDDVQLRQTKGTAAFLAPEMLTGDPFNGKVRSVVHVSDRIPNARLACRHLGFRNHVVHVYLWAFAFY